MCTVGLIVLSAASAFSRRGRVFSLIAIMVATVVTLGLPAQVQVALQGHAIFVFAWLVATLIPTRTAVGALVLCTAASVIVRWYAAGTGAALTAVDEGVTICAMALAAGFVRQAGVTTMLAVDCSDGARQRQALNDRLVEADAAAVDRARQSLHDEAIGALVAIAMANTDDFDLRRRVGRVAEHFERPTGSFRRQERTSLQELLLDLASRSGLDVTVIFGRSDRWPPLSDMQVGVVRRAVGELLRNAKRHAEVSVVRVAADSIGGWYRVTIADEGRGFDPAVNSSWGRRHSVQEPVESIGGQVLTRSTPGQGTSVAIEWPSIDTDRSRPNRIRTAYAATRAAAPDAIRAVIVVLMAVTLSHVYLAIRYSWGRASAIAQLLIGAITLTLTFMVLGRLRQAALNRRQLMLVSLVLATALASGLALAGPGSLRSFDSWMVGLSSVALMGVVFFSDWLVALLFSAPAVTVLAATTMVDSTVAAADTAGAYVSLILTTLASWICGSALRHVSRQQRSESRRLAELSGTAYRIRAEQQAQRIMTPFTRSIVIPWLRAVQEGVVALGAAETRAKAAELADQVRDELYVGEALDPQLRRRVGAARRGGLRIDFEHRNGMVLPTASIPLRLLDRLLDDISGLSALRVAVPTSTMPSWTLAILPASVAKLAVVRLGPALAGLEHEVVLGDFAITICGVEPWKIHRT